MLTGATVRTAVLPPLTYRGAVEGDRRGDQAGHEQQPSGSGDTAAEMLVGEAEEQIRALGSGGLTVSGPVRSRRVIC